MKTTQAPAANTAATPKLTSSPPNPCWPDPEFVDCRGLEAAFGIKRSLAYALLADRKIRGVSLRRRSQVRGKRLFSVDSVRDYLRAEMKNQAQ
jgi:hypothetical protein